MDLDTKPVTHILGHFARDKSSERLVAFEVYNKGHDHYDNYLLLITPGTALSVELDREQAEDLIDVLRNTFALEGADGGWDCTYRCYDLPSHDVDSVPSKSKKRKRKTKEMTTS
jgi:hypothetical protein